MTSSNEPPGPGRRDRRGRRRPPTIDLKATEVRWRNRTRADRGRGRRSAAGAERPPRDGCPSDCRRMFLAAGRGRRGRRRAHVGCCWRSPACSRAATTGAPAVGHAARARGAAIARNARRKPPRAGDTRGGRRSRRPARAAGNPCRFAAAAGRGSGAGEPDRDARRRHQGAGRKGRRARPAQRRHRFGRGRGAHARGCGHARRGCGIAEVAGAGHPTVQPAEIEALANRIAALERAAKALEAQLAATLPAASGADRSLRLVVVASTLNATVERGAPFAAELTAAQGGRARSAKGWRRWNRSRNQACRARRRSRASSRR